MKVISTCQVQASLGCFQLLGRGPVLIWSPHPMYGCMMATRQGFPGTQRPVLAMDSTAFPALPTVVRQHAKQVPRLILRSMRNHLGTATEVVKIHFKKNKYSAQRIYKVQLFCPSSQLRDDGKLSRQLRNMTPLFVSVLIRI